MYCLRVSGLKSWMLLAGFGGLLLLLSVAQPLHSQGYFDEYTPLETSGEAPEEFRRHFTQKYAEEAEEAISGRESKRERKRKEAFLLQSSYFLDDLLKSGKVLYNDPVTNYINSIADVILENQPDLRQELQFYAVKSPAANAFTTDRGVVLINLGLVSQLTSEAQLAFILCHEIVHYQEKHSLARYLRKEEINSDKGVIKGMNQLERYLAQKAYSRQQELTADEQGLKLYLKTPYARGEVNKVFDVLLYSYLPFDEVSFPKDFFEGKHYHYTAEFFLEDEEKNPITMEGDYEDTLSTHPNIEKRRKRMQVLIDDAGKGAGKAYVQDKEQFHWVRDIARFEVTRLRRNQKEYARSIYNAFLLLRDYPDSYFLQRIIATNLYAIAAFANDYSLYEIDLDPEEVEGESQQLVHFLNEHNREHLTVLALREMWALHEAYPEKKGLYAMAKHLAYMLADVNNLIWTDFAHVPPKSMASAGAADSASQEDEALPAPEDADRNAVNDLQGASDQAQDKYEKIKAKKKASEQEVSSEEADELYHHAFVRFVDEDDFEEMMTAAANLAKHVDDAQADDEPIDAQTEQSIDKVVLIDPVNWVINFRKREALRLLETDDIHRQLVEYTAETGEMAGIDFQTLQVQNLAESEKADFNDVSLIHEFIMERVSNDDVDLYNLMRDETDYLIDKYGTRFFGISGMANMTLKEQEVGAKIISSIFLPPVLPAMVIDLLSPDRQNYGFVMIYDIKLGQPAFAYSWGFETKASTDMLRSTLYRMALRLKHTTY